MNKIYKYDLKCNICGMEFSTGECKTKIGIWLKKKYLMRKHYHTRAEVTGYNMFGIYIPTTKKKWEK
jgi:hypothetical protein